MSKEIEVQILGKNFTFQLASGVDPEEFLQVADYVEGKFKKIRNRMGELDSFKLGLLAAVNITQEFFSLKKENEKLQAILKNIDRLLSLPEENDQVTIR